MTVETAHMQRLERQRAAGRDASGERFRALVADVVVVEVQLRQRAAGGNTGRQRFRALPRSSPILLPNIVGRAPSANRWRKYAGMQESEHFCTNWL